MLAHGPEKNRAHAQNLAAGRALCLLRKAEQEILQHQVILKRVVGARLQVLLDSVCDNLIIKIFQHFSAKTIINLFNLFIVSAKEKDLYAKMTQQGGQHLEWLGIHGKYLAQF